MSERRAEPPERAGVPSDALSEAQQVQEAASAVGFDWPAVAGVMHKLVEETMEMETAIADEDGSAIRHELGDLLFTLVNLARFVEIDASAALREATARFSSRFEQVAGEVDRSGRNVKECSLEELDALWEQVKRRRGGGDGTGGATEGATRQDGSQ